jgi:hypothetical protein
MKKRNTIIAKIFLVTTLLFSNIFSASAVTAPNHIDFENEFNYSPSRSGIEYIRGMDGLDYVSFNNFINNPNIPNDSRGACLDTKTNNCPALPGNPGVSKEERRRFGDERLFTLSKHCAKGICPTKEDDPKNVYYNFLQDTLYEGDKVRFEVYFHNNSKDPFLNPSVPTAKNVEVGIDLNNIVDATQSNLIKPKGYIYAENNSYLNTNVKTATNDTLMLRYSTDLYLEMVPNSTTLWMYLETDREENQTVKFYDIIKEKTELNFTTLKNTIKKITVTPNINNNLSKMWLHFDELPGCFGYSGFAYFDAVVKKRPEMPFCTEMTIPHSDTVQINNSPAYELNTVIEMSDNKMPQNSYLHLYSDDKDAKLFTKTGNTYTPILQTSTGGDFSIFRLNTNNLSNTIFYQGKEKLSITPKNDGYIFAQICFVEFTPPPIPIECVDLEINSTKQTEKFQNLDVYELKVAKLEFEPTETKTPDGTYISWKATEGTGNLYTKNDQGDYVEAQTALFNENDILYFIGSGKVEVKTIDPFNNIWEKCTAVLEFAETPPEAPICEEILVNYRFPVEAETQTRFASKSIDTKNQNFNEKITYKVDPGFGFFSETKCEDLKDNPNPQITEFQSATARVFPYFSKTNTKYQANTLSASQREKLLNQSVIQAPKSLNQQLIQGDIQLQTTQSYNIEKLQDINPIRLNPVQTLQQACNGKTELTVDAGKEVYFYAFKQSNGQNVIHITTNNTTVSDCERHLAIGPKPPTPEMPACIDLSLTNQQETINGIAGLKLTPTHVFSPIYVSGVETLPLVYTNWTTTDGLGKFFTKSGNTYTDQGNSYKQNALILTTPDGRKYYQFEAVYYQGENPLTKQVEIEAKTYDANNNLFVPCVQKVVLNPTPEMPVCLSLETYDYSDPENPKILQSLEANSHYILTNDTRYTSEPEENKTTYTSSEGVFIAIPKFPHNNANTPDLLSANTIINTYILLAEDILESGLTRASASQANLRETITVDDGQFVVFLTYQDAEDNPNALTVRATNRTEIECIKSYPLLQDLVCLDLMVIDWTTATNPKELSSPLKENSYYELGTTLVLSKDIAGQIKYSSDSGVFLVVPRQGLTEDILTRNLLEDTYRQLALDLVESSISKAEKGALPQEITVDSKQTVFFITFVDAETTNNALRVEYADGPFDPCIKNYSLENTPPPEIKECLELEIIYPSGEWDFDDLSNNGSQRFELEVKTDPEEYAEEINYRWTVRPSYSGNWEDGSTTTIPENVLKDIEEDEEPRVVIQAYDKNTNIDLPYCRATLEYKYEEIPPEIEKFVYDKKRKSI